MQTLIATSLSIGSVGPSLSPQEVMVGDDAGDAMDQAFADLFPLGPADPAGLSADAAVVLGPLAGTVPSLAFWVELSSVDSGAEVSGAVVPPDLADTVAGSQEDWRLSRTTGGSAVLEVGKPLIEELTDARSGFLTEVRPAGAAILVPAMPAQSAVPEPALVHEPTKLGRGNLHLPIIAPGGPDPELSGMGARAGDSMAPAAAVPTVSASEIPDAAAASDASIDLASAFEPGVSPKPIMLAGLPAVVPVDPGRTEPAVVAVPQPTGLELPQQDEGPAKGHAATVVEPVTSPVVPIAPGGFLAVPDAPAPDTGLGLLAPRIAPQIDQTAKHPLELMARGTEALPPRSLAGGVWLWQGAFITESVQLVQSLPVAPDAPLPPAGKSALSLGPPAAVRSETALVVARAGTADPVAPPALTDIRTAVQPDAATSVFAAEHVPVDGSLSFAATPFGTAGEGKALPAVIQSAIAQPSLPQLAGQIVEALSRNSDGIAQFALSPEELGRVHVSLQADALSPDRVSVMLAFERPETMDLFRRHVDQLAEALRVAGYSGVDISFGQNSAGAGGSDMPDQTAAEQSQDAPVQPVSTVEVARPIRLATPTSLDLRL